MSPNMTCEALQSFSPRLTVAKRKEALELRKVSEVTGFCFIILNISSAVLHLLWRMDAKYYVFFSDYETFDGKKTARPHQRQPEPFEEPHPSPYRQRCKLLYIFQYMQRTLFRYTKVKTAFSYICLTFAFYYFLQKTRYSKLEKADILEMTVRFLSDIPPVNNKSEFWFCLFNTFTDRLIYIQWSLILFEQRS